MVVASYDSYGNARALDTANYRLASFRQRETKHLESEVQAMVVISEGLKNKRMQIWTSSEKSMKKMEAPTTWSVLGYTLDLKNIFFRRLKTLSRKWKGKKLNLVL
jgi:hypothetical protein